MLGYKPGAVFSGKKHSKYNNIVSLPPINNHGFGIKLSDMQ